MKNNNIEHKVFIAIVGVFFAAMTILFLFFPRSKYSELEKRDLSEFPGWELLRENPQEFTAAVSQWFSDSEPYRDNFMSMSMNLRDAMRVTVGDPEEAVSFKPAVAESAEPTATPTPEDPQGNPLADENAKVANAGILIVGSGKNVRALMAFGGSEKAGLSFIDLVNEYASTFPHVNVYALIAPLATEFYIPEKAADKSRPQKPMIYYVRDHLSEKAKFVDAYSSLAAHTHEDIYLRTDHHWAPLGAFYAAKKFAETANVPFRGLESYEKHVVKDFVGTMYGYSKDIAVKNAPEEFVYYTPNELDYTTTYITYNINKNYQVSSQSKPWKGKFFHHFKDGSGGAYSTFMGGDRYLVKVETGVPGNRRLMIIKDSYGNAIPGYLFYSFNEVHVVDFRYFKENMKDYIAGNNITDILFAFNVFNASSGSVAQKARNFISQRAGNFNAAPDKKTSSPSNSSGNGENKGNSEPSEYLPVSTSVDPVPVQSEPEPDPSVSQSTADPIPTD